MSTRLEKLFLVGGLVLLPFGNLLRFDLGGGIVLLTLDVLMGILLLTSVWDYSHILTKFSQQSKAALLLLGFMMLSLLMATFTYPLLELLIGGAYLLRFAAYIHYFFTLKRQSPIFKQKYLRMLQVAGMTYVLMSLFQYVFFPDLRPLFVAGWDEHLYRIFGTFFDPNFSGALFVGVSILSVSFIRKRSSDRLNIFYVSSAILSFLAVLLTYSRSSYIMLLVAGATYIGVIGRKKLLLPLSFLLILGIVLIPKNYRSEGVNLFRTASIEARLQEYKEAITIFSKHPVLGVGFNMYRSAQHTEGFLETYNSARSWREDHAGAGVPNSYLFILATTGMLGLAAFIYFWKTLLWTQISSLPVITATMAGLGAHALFENSLFYPFLMLWMFALLASADVGIPSQRKSLNTKEQ